MSPPAVPLTVIGGFLGAGKTTLLNALLMQADGRRIAVLVNDFGDLQIDAALIAQRSATTIGLRNGCVCCSLAGGLINALSEVLALDPRPDHAVVEASGVSDPRRIAQVARVGAGFSAQPTLVVVAADQIETLIEDAYVGDTVIAQLAAADLLILNKIDLVDEAHKQRVCESLQTRAPQAAVIETDRADLPIEIALGPLQVRGMPKLEMSPRSLRSQSSHAVRFEARTFRCGTPIDETMLRGVLDQLPRSVLRLKGFVRMDADPDRPRLVQAVGTRWTISDADPNVDQQGSALVMIGARDSMLAADFSRFEQLFNELPG